MELWKRKPLDKHTCNIVSDAEKLFGVDVQKSSISAMLIATNEVIYRKIQL